MRAVENATAVNDWNLNYSNERTWVRGLCVYERHFLEIETEDVILHYTTDQLKSLIQRNDG